MFAGIIAVAAEASITRAEGSRTPGRSALRNWIPFILRVHGIRGPRKTIMPTLDGLVGTDSTTRALSITVAVMRLARCKSVRRREPGNTKRKKSGSATGQGVRVHYEAQLTPGRANLIHF